MTTTLNKTTDSTRTLAPTVVSAELFERIEQYATRENITLASAVRDLLDKALR